jgi:hypothetical protein
MNAVWLLPAAVVAVGAFAVSLAVRRVDLRARATLEALRAFSADLTPATREVRRGADEVRESFQALRTRRRGPEVSPGR